MGLFSGILPTGMAGWLNPSDPSSGVIASPQDVQRQQAYAQALMQGGSSYAPIQSKWQGLDRLAQGLVGGYQAGQADKAQAAGQKSANDAWASLLPSGTSSPTSGMANVFGSSSAPALASGLSSSPIPTQANGSGSLPTFAAGVGTPGGASPNTQAALSFYQAKGLSPVAAAALVGGYTQESGKGLNPSAVAYGDGQDGSNAIGVVQWNGSRAAGLRSFAAANGLNPSDINTQLQYSWAELNGPEKGTLTALQNAQNPIQATAAALGYERPAGWSAQNPLGAKTAGARLAATNGLLSGGGAVLPLRGGVPAQSASLPTLAASGLGQNMAMAGTGFGPIGSSAVSARPAAMAFAPPPAIAASPAQAAITGVAGPAGDPLVSVPGYQGQWNKAKIDAAPDGTDVPDDGELAKAQNVPSASPLPASAPITTSPQAPSPVAPQGGVNMAALQAVLNNPWSTPAQQQIASALLERQLKSGQVDPISINNKLVDRNTGRVLGDFSDSKSDARPVTAAERQAYGLGDSGAFEIQDGKVFAVPGTYDAKTGAAGNHVIVPGGALVDNAGHPLYTNSGSEGGGMDEATVNSLANRVYLGDTTALTGLSRGAQGSANIAKVQARVAQIAAENQGKPKPVVPEGDILTNRADQMGEQAGARASGTLNARMDTYAAEASSTMNQAIEASRTLPRSEWKPVNDAVQYVQNKGSDPRYAAFNAQTNAVINTYAKAINPTGVPTDSDKQHAREVLSTAQSPEAYEATIRQLQREINVAHTAARGARAAERSGAAAQNMAVAPQNDAAPGATSGGILDTILHPFGGGSAPAAPPVSPSTPVQIKNVDDYAKLPSGTSFIDPAGNVRVKK